MRVPVHTTGLWQWHVYRKQPRQRNCLLKLKQIPRETLWACFRGNLRMLLFFPWQFWNGHFGQAKSEENKQVTHYTAFSWEENALPVFGCSFPCPLKAANYTSFYSLCCDMKEILDIVAQKRLGLKWPLPAPLCLQHFKTSWGKAWWILFSLIFSRPLTRCFEGGDRHNDT